MIDPCSEVARLNVLQSETEIVTQAPIRIKHGPIRSKDHDVMRNDIDELLKLSLTLSELGFSPLTLGDVHHRPNVLGYARFIS